MGKLKIDIRRNKILDELKKKGHVNVSELAKELNATQVTIRNDLSALEQDGYLIRRQGGAIAAPSEAQLFNGFARNAIIQLDEKKAIAEYIVSLISDGDTVFLNSGTTTQIMAEALKQRNNLRIVTNSLAVATDLSTVSSFSVILLGGEVNVQYGFVSGADAQQQLSKYQADWSILSIDGISLQGGATTYHSEEAIIDTMMIEHSRKHILAADYTKIGRAGFSNICDLNPSVHLVTDKRSDKNVLHELEASGLQITIVE